MTTRSPTAVFWPEPLDPLPPTDAGWLVGRCCFLMQGQYQGTTLVGTVPGDYAGGSLAIQLPMQGPVDQTATVAWEVAVQLDGTALPLVTIAFTTAAPGTGGLIGCAILPPRPELTPGARYSLQIARPGDDPRDTSTAPVALHINQVRLVELPAEAA